MAFSQIATSVSILSSGLKGYNAISLTNFVASAQSLIASGSAVEVANAFFLADANITPNASSWTAVTTANTAYITLTPSGSSGSQILTAMYSETVPIWSDSKQGFYQSAGSLVRYIGSVNKTGTSSYEWAVIFPTKQGELIYKTIDIGSWDMDTDSTKTIVHRQDWTKIRTLDAMIINDAESTYYQLVGDTRGSNRAQANTLTLSRGSSGTFDTTNFNDTAINRGYVIVGYTL